jgi:hypothetical protein
VRERGSNRDMNCMMETALCVCVCVCVRFEQRYELYDADCVVCVCERESGSNRDMNCLLETALCVCVRFEEI